MTTTQPPQHKQYFAVLVFVSLFSESVTRCIVIFAPDEEAVKTEIGKISAPSGFKLSKVICNDEPPAVFYDAMTGQVLQGVWVF